MSEQKLILQSSPHVRDVESVNRIMYTVILALLPAAVAAVVIFGWSALMIMAVCVVSCLAVEAGALRLMGKPVKPFLLDGSAVVTGLLVAMNLPSGWDVWWLAVIGAAVAIALGKAVFGGLGNNPFNPALVARVFLLISFPTAMTNWPVTEFSAYAVDVVTAATPLGLLKAPPETLTGIQALTGDPHLTSGSGLHWNLFLGNVGGCLGETSGLALLLGGLFLLWRRIISWHIPVTYIATVAVFTGIFWLVDPNKYADPLFHVLAGGVMLGAWFMATDMVTSPVTKKGQLLFGLGCGLVTCVIRLFAGYPEGVSFSILIMNGLVPLIDRYVKPAPFEERAAVRAGEAA